MGVTDWYQDAAAPPFFPLSQTCPLHIWLQRSIATVRRCGCKQGPFCAEPSLSGLQCARTAKREQTSRQTAPLFDHVQEGDKDPTLSGNRARFAEKECCSACWALLRQKQAMLAFQGPAPCKQTRPGTPPRVGSRVVALSSRQCFPACRTAPLVIDHALGGPAKLKHRSRSPEPRGGRYSSSKTSRLSDEHAQGRSKDREDYREERGERRMATHALPGYGPGRSAEDASVVDFIKVGLLRDELRPGRVGRAPDGAVPPPSPPAAGCRWVARSARLRHPFQPQPSPALERCTRLLCSTSAHLASPRVITSLAAGCLS